MGLLDWVHSTAFPVLRGRDLLLRLPQGGDFAAWRALRHESRDFLVPWEPLWTADELTVDSYRARLRRYRQDARERSGYTFFIFDEAGRELRGGLTLGRIQRGVAQSATIGYWMGEPHAGRGTMTEAVRTVATFAFDVAGLHRLEAACLPRNERSARLLARCGFRREGHLRSYLRIAGAWEDHHLYALLADDARTGDASSSRRREPVASDGIR